MSEYKPNVEKLMTEVYSYEFPEVSELLGKISYNPEISNNDLPIDEADRLVQELYGFDPPLCLPEAKDGTGTLDLDELNAVFVDRVRSVVEQQIHGLDTFEHSYVGHGSSDLLAKIIMEGAAKGNIKQLCVVRGEYEGYKAYADAVNLPVVEYDSLESVPEPKEGSVWFISNPSAVDGDQINKSVFDNFVKQGHEMVLDAAYVGLTDPLEIDVSADNILGVTISPSKIFGVFRRRMTGIAFVRKPISSLYGSKWFKDIPAMFEPLKLYETFAPDDIPKIYQRVQLEICAGLSKEFGVEVSPSNVLLLGQVAAGDVKSEEQERRLRPYRRGDNYRLGLTKLFQDYEDFRATEALTERSQNE